MSADDAQKISYGFFFFSHKRIIFMSFSGVCVNGYVCQASEAFAVGRGCWLLLDGEGVVSEGGWRLRFQI